MNTMQEGVSSIEAIRGGVPTRSSTKLLPDLRPEVIEGFRERLASVPGSSGAMIWGNYGSGKSHVLTTMEHVAHEMGFAVSSITLSRTLSPANLPDIYATAAQSVMLPGSSIPGFDHRLADKRRDQLPIELREATWEGWSLPGSVLTALVGNGDPDARHTLYSFLTGGKVALGVVNKAIKDAIPGCRPPRGGMPHGDLKAKAWFQCTTEILRFLGCKGWILLLDEAELISRLGRVTGLKACLNLAWLLGWDDTDKPNPGFITLAGAARSWLHLWYNPGYRSMTYQDLLKDACLQKQPATLPVLDSFFERAIEGSDAITLGSPSPEAYLPLLERLRLHHAVAYEWEPPAMGALLGILEKHLDPDAPPRLRIRGLVEVLDHARYTGKLPVIDRMGLEEDALTEDATYFSGAAISDVSED